MKLALITLICLPIVLLSQQQKTFKIRTVAFYNVENLFNTTNDTLVYDNGRTPEGKYAWTEERYQQKIDNTAKVLSEIGMEITNASPDIISLCEVENYSIMEILN